MTVFVDTGVFFAHHDRSATRHEAAADAMEVVLAGEFGQPHTSDYVLDEAVTLTRTRADSHEAAVTIAHRILGRHGYPSLVELLRIDGEVLEETLAVFERYADQSLSFTDASTIALAEHRDIDAVLSFDDEFEGLVERIDPASL